MVGSSSGAALLSPSELRSELAPEEPCRASSPEPLAGPRDPGPPSGSRRCTERAGRVCEPDCLAGRVGVRREGVAVAAADPEPCLLANVSGVATPPGANVPLPLLPSPLVDRNPKDFVLWYAAQAELGSTGKDNTGRREYKEGIVFPTLEFPSDHGITWATLDLL